MSLYGEDDLAGSGYQAVPRQWAGDPRQCHGTDLKSASRYGVLGSSDANPEPGYSAKRVSDGIEARVEATLS